MNGEPKGVVRIGLVQRRLRGSRDETIQATIDGVRDAAGQGARLVCLQELFSDPYFCQKEDPAAFELAEVIDGPLIRQMSEVACKYEVTLVVPFFEKRAPGIFHNSALIVGPNGRSLGHYRKMHIPDDPQFMEKYYFTPGDLGYQAIETPGLKVGPLICWDQWYPEAARLTAMAGAEVLLYPTAIGWLPSEKESEGEAQLSAWQTIQRSHAISNGVFVVAVNRVGIEGPKESGIEFWGHSFVVDPLGRVIAAASTEEEVLVCDLDLSLIAETRKWWPFFRDRRIDSYGDLTKRWRDS
jgi:N-carbamoylputrescine amidase